jgi:transaldolase
MTTLGRIFEEQGQSLWLDNLTRPYLREGTLTGLVAAGIRGVTANPTIVARAIESSDAYDEQFETLISAGHTVEDAYWELVISDVVRALEILRPTFDQSHGGDGFVSIEVAPRWANDTDATVVAARALHERIREPNLLVKIPATAEGVRAIETMIGEGRSINVTLVFSLRRYSQVLDAYLSGLETLVRRGGDLSAVHSVASFFVSRVDTEVDRRLDTSGTQAALKLRGRAAVAQAKLAYQMFRKTHSGERWERLAQQGARVQRPLWASTSTKNPNYLDTLYVDNLIGPDTVNTLPESTLEAFADHGTVARTIDTRVEDALAVMAALSTVGVDMDDVGYTLEAQGIAAFNASVAHVLGNLEAKPRASAPQRAQASSTTGHGEPHPEHAAVVGEPLIDSAASNQLSKAGADEQADGTVCVQVVAEASGSDVGANEGG